MNEASEYLPLTLLVLDILSSRRHKKGTASMAQRKARQRNATQRPDAAPCTHNANANAGKSSVVQQNHLNIPTMDAVLHIIVTVLRTCGVVGHRAEAIFDPPPHYRECPRPLQDIQKLVTINL